MIIRETPKCIICGKDIAKAVYDTKSEIIGDNFLYWEFIDHECDQEKIEKIRKEFSEIGKTYNLDYYDLKHETKMVQARIVSPLIKIIEVKGYTVNKLSELTNLTETKIDRLLNGAESITMEELALFQKALDVVIEPPFVLTKEEHNNKYYDTDEEENVCLYCEPTSGFYLGTACPHCNKPFRSLIHKPKKK